MGKLVILPSRASAPDPGATLSTSRGGTWRALLASTLCGLALAAPAPAQVAAPHAIDIPRWFSETFLDFKDEAAEASRAGKRVLLYFGQDGCPYCKALMKSNFGPGPIADKTRRHFVAIAINIWGDRETTWIDGRRRSEKELARHLNVQFTPTLMFLDADATVALRLDGYQAPQRFTHILDWVIAQRGAHEALADYLASIEATGAPAPAPRAYLMRDARNLARRPGAKPLAVLFESAGCKACIELHEEAFRRRGMVALLPRFDVARLLSGQALEISTPSGKRQSAREFARDLRITMHPTAVFFDERGAEVFRFDGYLRPFHIESAFEYVASGAYRSQPQFQRYVQARAERLRAAGQPVDLWR